MRHTHLDRHVHGPCHTPGIVKTHSVKITRAEGRETIMVERIVYADRSTWGQLIIHIAADSGAVGPDQRLFPYQRFAHAGAEREAGDRKSTRLNSSHLGISYAVFR